MRLRTATTCVFVAALVVAAPAFSEKPHPTQGAYVAKCNKAERSAAFVGTMRAVKDSESMWMRFTLLERVLPSRAFAPLSVPGLDVWRKSRPEVKRFSFRQRVRALEEAAMYKVEVEFRWYDAEGELIREALERSRRCRQPGDLPNLVILRIGRRPNGQYFARVANTGRDVATGASVQLFVDGQDAGTLPLPDIPPGEARAASFDGALCVGSVQAVADPTASVRESAEDDNALTQSCAALLER